MSRVSRVSGIALIAIVMTASTAGAVSTSPTPTRAVEYVPSIVSIPANPHWGRQITYGIQIRSHLRAPTTVGLDLLLYLSAPVGRSTTELGVYHRTLQVPANGIGRLAFTTTAPSRPSSHQVCLGITVVGDSTGAYVCSPVT